MLPYDYVAVIEMQQCDGAAATLTLSIVHGIAKCYCKLSLLLLLQTTTDIMYALPGGVRQADKPSKTKLQTTPACLPSLPASPSRLVSLQPQDPPQQPSHNPHPHPLAQGDPSGVQLAQVRLSLTRELPSQKAKVTVPAPLDGANQSHCMSRQQVTLGLTKMKKNKTLHPSILHQRLLCNNLLTGVRVPCLGCQEDQPGAAIDPRQLEALALGISLTGSHRALLRLCQGKAILPCPMAFSSLAWMDCNPQLGVE